MKQFFPSLIGNEQLKNQLGNDILSGTLSHAFILSGPAGSGRHTLALSLAMALNCQHKSSGSEPLPCGYCASCKKFLAHQHPDLTVVGKEKDRATLGVDAIRNVRTDTSYPPTEGGYKIYVIEEAETMTAEAQNALLLTLESPPEYVVFLLLSQNPALLLETVRSRAPTLRLERLSDETVSAYLVSHSSSAKKMRDTQPEVFSRLLHTSAGNLGVALSLLESKSRAAADKRNELGILFLNALRDKKALSSINLIKSLSPLKRPDLAQAFNLFNEILRDLYLCKQSGFSEFLFFETEAEVQAVADCISSQKLAGAIDATTEALDQIGSNMNVSLLLHVWAVGCGIL
ncbi:MAG: DNA polymerase III subunit [Clostridia bacterium]|nr:DNA polymerase III subunit [Clostridia bacterium]